MDMSVLGIRRTWNPKTDGEAKRPFRLWDSKLKRDIPSRRYATEYNALNAALILCKWMKIDHSIEVYSVVGGKLIGVYKRHVNSVSFTK